MAFLLDTNILLRLVDPAQSLHPEAKRCVHLLLRRKESIHVVPQIIYEFWVVATRPTSVNGFGLQVEDVRRKIGSIARFFAVLPEIPAIYHEWLRIVETYSVVGVGGHDARIVAGMKVHGVDQLVTFNCQDFARYKGKEIKVATPAEILESLGAPM